MKKRNLYSDINMSIKSADIIVFILSLLLLVAFITAFVLGADIYTDGSGSDFKMTNFSIIDTKIYAVALNRNQVDTAYKTAVENFG